MEASSNGRHVDCGMGFESPASGRAAVGRRAKQWCCATAVMAVVFLALAPAIGSGCGGDACGAACQNTNKLGCSGTCDCAACSGAPASCQNFFSCSASRSTCLDIFLNCTEPPECASYVAKHCK